MSGLRSCRYLPSAILQPHSSCFAFAQDFEQDAFGFQQKVEDIDRRLGTVFIQAFDDASDLEHAFKVCLSHPCSFLKGKSGRLQFGSVRIALRRPDSAGAAGARGWCFWWGWTEGQRDS